MLAACELCGEILVSASRGFILLDKATSPDNVDAMAEIAEFDMLAAKVSDHLSQRHPEHAAEMAAVAHLAAKVYAMTWAENATQKNYGALRESWRAAILNQLGTVYKTGAPAPASSSPDSPAATGEASNEKKSVKKASI